MIRFALSFFIITHSFSVLANTIEFTAKNSTVTCDLVRNDLKPAINTYNDGTSKGILIGYNAKGNIPVARTLIIDPNQSKNIQISSRPKLINTGTGCLFKFVATSPPGFDFYKIDFDDLLRKTSKFTSAQLLPSE